MLRRIAAVMFVGLVGAPLLHACTLCGAGAQGRHTLRQEARQAKLVVYGTLANPRLGAGNGTGATDLQVEQVIKSDPVARGRQVLTLARWIPVDAKAPPKFLVFCDVFNGQLDPYQGSPVKSAQVVEYLKGAMALEQATRHQQLAYFGRHLDHADSDVAADAFLEWAKSNDADVAAAARQLEPARLRKLLTDANTPSERLGLFAYLLGACGSAADADLLARLLRQPDERTRPAYGGMLAGYIMLRPTDGWKLAHSVVGDPQRKYPEKAAVVGTLRFFQASQPAARAEILKGVALVLPQGDMADLAVEDLRRWQWWDLTTDVLAQFDSPSHASPLVRRSIVRYAIGCPRPEAQQFIETLRQKDPKLLLDVQASIAFEAPPTPGIK